MGNLLLVQPRLYPRLAAQGLSAQQKLDYLQKKQNERESIRQEILELSKSRTSYVAEKKLEQAVAAPSVSDALSGAIRKRFREST